MAGLLLLVGLGPMDYTTLKMKIKSVRDAFLKEFKKVELSKKTGADADDIYEPSLCWYENALFLKKSTAVIVPSSNLVRTGVYVQIKNTIILKYKVYLLLTI